jgi:hypothetical protein
VPVWLLQLWQHAAPQLLGVTGSAAVHHVGSRHRAVLLPPCELLHQQEFLLQPEDDAVSQSQAVSLPPPANIILCYTHLFFVYKCGHNGSLSKTALYKALAIRIVLNCMVHLQNDYYCEEYRSDMTEN